MKQLPPKLEFRPHLNTGVIVRDYDMALMTKYVNELRDYLSDKECRCGKEFLGVYEYCSIHNDPKASKGECEACGGLQGVHRYTKKESLCPKLYPPQQEECPKCGKKMEGMYCCDLSSQEALDILKDVEPNKERDWEEELHDISEKGLLPLYFVTEYISKNFTLNKQEESRGEYPFQHDFEPDKSGKCWCNIPKESGYHAKPQLKEESPKEDETPQADWVKEFDRRFGIDDDWDSQLYHYLPDGLKIANKDVKAFISKVESLTQQRTEKKIILGLEELANSKLGKSVYQDGIRQGIRESQKYISDLNN